MPTQSTSHSAPAVVINMDCFTGLQSIRILAQRGVPIIGVAKDAAHYCSRTNFCKQKTYVDTMTTALIDKLVEMGPTLPEKGVLFPCADTSVLLISEYRERLDPWYHIALPDHDSVATLMDKQSFIEYGLEQNLPIPQVFFLRSRSDAEEAADKIRYPCIMKPTLKSKRWEENAKYKAYTVNDAAELLRTYDEHASLTDVLMVQRFVHGSEDAQYTCNCYFGRDGQPLVSFVSRKLRQWPHRTGTASLSVACRNTEVEHATLNLFSKANYRGLGYLEVKQDAEDGKYYIIEPNIGRPTGRSALAEASGVELLYSMYCELTGAPLPENRTQDDSTIKWIYFRRDLQSAVKYWRNGELTLRQWCQSLRGRKVDALFHLKDLRPFLGDWWRAFKNAVLGKRR